jgi:hypothetical protein
MRHWIAALTLMATLITLFLAILLGGTPSALVEDSTIKVAYTIDGLDLSTSAPEFINVCSQHAPKCPLEEETWDGEPGAWQYTGKKWQRHTDTPSGRNVIWEWSRPYAGSNEAYADQRENRYADFTAAPASSPDFEGTGPFTYDWERWELGEDNNIFHQYGRATEGESFHIGKSDCESGVYYPVVDHNLAYADTPMSVLRDGHCVGGGYLAAYRAEMWAEPLSPQRVAMCDNAATGIPTSQSPKGNAICRVSPYVGVVYQRYAWGAGPPPVDKPDVGCEAVVYAWGWPKPEPPSDGQAHQEWFRNGELRFTKWINLSDQATDAVPQPDDHAWWDPRCKPAFSDTTNVVYSGQYKIGSTVFTDTIALPLTVTGVIPTDGGSLTSAIDHIAYGFPSNTFTDTVIVSHTVLFQSDFPPPGKMVGLNRVFDVTAVYSATGNLAQPTQPYTLTVQYTDAGKGAAIADTLALYRWNGTHWLPEPTSRAYTESNLIEARPTSFSLWAALGETQSVFLPFITREY